MQKCGTSCICCHVQCCSPVLLRQSPRRNHLISPTCRAHSSKPAARCCSGRMGQKWQTDRRTDTVPFHRPCSAYYAGSTNIDNKTMMRYIHQHHQSPDCHKAGRPLTRMTAMDLMIWHWCHETETVPLHQTPATQHTTTQTNLHIASLYHI